MKEPCKGLEILQRPYDETALTSLRAKLIAKLDGKTLQGKQYEEIDTLSLQLDIYKFCIVEEIQKFVKDINENPEVQKYRQEKDKQSCAESIRRIIDKQKKGKYYYSYIPQLKELLANYRDELSKDPLKTPTKSEKKIIDLFKE